MTSLAEFYCVPASQLQISIVPRRKIKKKEVYVSKRSFKHNSKYQALIAEARVRSTTPERLFEIRQEIRLLKRELRT